MINNAATAMQFFERIVRSNYSIIIADLGMSVAAQMLNDAVEFKPVDMDADIATFAVDRTVSGRVVVTLATFLRDRNSEWRVQGL